MQKPIQFENHLKERVMEVVFPEGFKIETEADLGDLKKAWQENLRRWHSPYTCLFDARNFEVSELQMPPFEKLIKFFGNFFMKKIVGFCEENAVAPKLPFDVVPGYDAAAKGTGLARGAGLTRDLTDLRQRIQIDNDFNAHVMEISFLAQTRLENKDDINILKSKLHNILMQWHSPYSVLFNCQNLSFSAEAKDAFAPLERFLRGFFCKNIVGYSPVEEKSLYPFPTHRARHLAAAVLEHSGLTSGGEANCSTRKKG